MKITPFKSKSFIGRRIIKTAIAVMITTAICLLLGLPAEFAAIAAIVTIEPTASDSIRKGLIRLPASAIGAAFAVAFVALWGVSALSFTLAAISTIYVCKKLKLDAGILVATLTAVAMIPDIEPNLLLAFLSRLATTSIGLIVSSLVNFFILPPKFLPLIKGSLRPNFLLASQVLMETTEKILNGNIRRVIGTSENYNKLRSSVERLNEISLFQEKEWKYHKISVSEYRNHYKLKQIIMIMQKIVLHLGNLQFVNEKAFFSEKEKELLRNLACSISTMLNKPEQGNLASYFDIVCELDNVLKEEAQKINDTKEYYHHFTSKRIVLFELLSLHDCIEELEKIRQSYSY